MLKQGKVLLFQFKSDDLSSLNFCANFLQVKIIKKSYCCGSEYFCGDGGGGVKMPGKQL